MGPFRGDYLSATSTFYGGSGAPAGTYGIFTSNSRGPGVIDHSYASNMNDASYYIGACPDCNQVLTHAHAEGSALGYSGTNSGGHLMIENSEWDLNNTGIVTNSQNNDDAPSPQVGLCPGSTTQSCTIFRNNYIHDNNNPNVPSAGQRLAGPARHGPGRLRRSLRHRHPEPGHRQRRLGHSARAVPGCHPEPARHAVALPGRDAQLRIVPGLDIPCFYDDWGNEVSDNSMSGNGFFGNPTNGDLADLSGLHDPGNCWHGNFHPDGSPVTSSPDDLQVTHGTCGVPNQGAGLLDPLSLQVICATQAFGPCPPPPGMNYPRPTNVQMLPLPPQTSMPSPCSGVPNNPWCKNPHGAG